MDEIDFEFFHVEYPDEVSGEPDKKIERMTELALSLSAEYPNKRLLVHFIPPHHPYVGPTAEERLPSFEAQSVDFLAQIRRSEVDVPDPLLRQVYRENLDRILPRVRELVEGFRGRTVVSADHGEILGERLRPIPVREYGHFSNLYTDELVEIPWHICPGGERKDISADQPLESESVDEAIVDDRLRDLGYKL
jgi:hypothetical protein